MIKSDYSEQGQVSHQRLTETYGINDPGGLLLVDLIVSSFETYRQAQECISKHGVLMRDRSGGWKQNPACQTARDAKMTILGSIKALNLEFHNIIEQNAESEKD